MDLLGDFEIFFAARGITADVIYKDTMLSNGDTAIGIYEYSGSGANAQIAGATRSIQIVARAKAVIDAKAKVNALYATLQTEDGILHLTTERWCSIYLRQPPFKMMTDAEGRTYYCFNVGVTTYTD